MTMGVHHADTLNYYFGPIKKVFAFFNKLYTTADVEDVTMTTFQFESGALGYIGSSYVTPRTNWIYVYGTDAQLFCNLALPNAPLEEYLRIWPVVDKYTVLQLIGKTKINPKPFPSRSAIRSSKRSMNSPTVSVPGKNPKQTDREPW